jgi:hypothetical protein
MNTVVEFAGAFQSIGVDRIAGPDRHDGEIGGAGAIARGGGNEYNLGRNRR